MDGRMDEMDGRTDGRIDEIDRWTDGQTMDGWIYGRTDDG